MCGIVGYIGHKKSSTILTDGLLKLEYRGYDSVGIATIEDNSIKVLKTKGRVSDLQNNLDLQNLTSSIGIGHTRWATHGEPSSINSHPHMDNSNNFAVVHNGIIENYLELKDFLMQNGYNFTSQTDTEIIPNLIHYYYNGNLLETIKKSVEKLTGSFALCILSKANPDKIVVIRKDSPLVIGVGKDENFISSDIPAMLSNTRDFYLLNDYEYAEIYGNKLQIYDKDLKPIDKKIKNIEWDATSAEKEGFEDYMLKEIFEQPKSIRETIGTKISLNELTKLGLFKNNSSILDIDKNYLQNLNKIYIVACGTAMHAGLIGKIAFENLCSIPVEVDVASEFRYRNPIIDKKTLVILISQSGETADTIAALKLAKSKGAITYSISNVIGSSITREADFTLYTHAGPEIAVASTKAYTSQLIALYITAIYFAETLNTTSKEKLSELKSELINLPEKIQEVLSDNLSQIKSIAKDIYLEKNMFFIGRGIDYPVTLEGSLKLKEITYIHSEAYAAGELKHGPIALIEKGVTVISLITNPALIEKTMSNIQEVITRGAKTITLTSEELTNSNFDYIIKLPKTNTLLMPVISVIPLQLLAYYISKEKELDVDKPRNLAKSVTVE